MASSTQDEEVHHRKEEDVLNEEPELDLNKEAKTDAEAKHEDDDGKIVASETSEAEKRKIMEQEVKDANQEEESRGGTMVASMTTTTSPTQEEEEEKVREKYDLAAATLLSMTNEAVPPKNPSVLEIYDHEEDDSEQTLTFLTRWKAPKIPPKKIIHDRLIEQCSRPVQKQLTTSDVKQTRMSLPRRKFQQLLDESGRKDTRAPVYGPDGKVHEIWLRDVEERSFKLTIGWRKFVVEYELKECCDFVTFWMFRHRDTRRICLAVDAMRFGFRKQVSKRISDAAFEDSD